MLDRNIPFIEDIRCAQQLLSMFGWLTGSPSRPWISEKTLSGHDDSNQTWRFHMKIHNIPRYLTGMMFLLILCAGMTRSLPAQHNHDHAPNAVTVTGQNICLGCSLKKEKGAKAQCSAFGCRHGLRVEKITGPHGEDRSELARKGTVLHYLDNDKSKDLVGGHHGKSVMVAGRVYANEHILDVSSFKEMEGQAEAGESKDDTLAALFSKDSCCAKASQKGETCSHPCCAKAIAAGKVCEKCNPGAGEKQNLAAAAKLFSKDSCCAKAFAGGKACTHPCCVAAIATGKACSKCNPG
jgi:hypothetical protein